MAEVQLKVDRLKKEQKKRQELAAKIKVGLHGNTTAVTDTLTSGNGEQVAGRWAEHR